MTFKKFIAKSKHKSKYLFTKFVDRLFPFVFIYHKKKFIADVITEINKSAYMISPLDTLNAVLDFIKEKKPGAYMRFGDGDVFLAMGMRDMLQLSNETLAKEMQDAFSLKGRDLFKTLAIHSEQYGQEKEMFAGNHLQTEQSSILLVRQVFPYFVGYKIYSPVALHYAASYLPEQANYFLKQLKEQAILFIGNENTSQTIIEKMFGQVQHIKSPSKNSYDRINEIENDAINALKDQKEFGIVIISMGCGGRVLMKRLYKKGFPVFYFDFGSLLDGICGEITRPWLKENIDYEKLLKDL